ncbi:hypothetical protein SELMODRAFT_430897 [Selaginella moellendorffii]|uniref:Uncharacterized protein n=1 Tax=Selaginella moellendorffii TaxID=88036 RepID=D8TAV9_SELML|nr:uncharacterized protein LOC9645391 [Selaginella moellendorffii]EFJ06193.1 hypothetical protein SELMODRAFT_430897 [Selaginella moellendorffii]|eukprot:XP_002992712.1 uncharacterized protein LOC9645391 [Selaginella moellendorffii]
MDHHKCGVLLLLAIAALAAALVRGDSIVSGNVFCDQCLHGRPSMWGIPIRGAKVLVHCRNRQGMAMAVPAMSNFLGAFVANFPGEHDLQHCTSRLMWSPLKQCNVVANAQQSLRLEWKILDNAFYTVKPLYFTPVKPLAICPVSRPKLDPIVVPKAPAQQQPSSYCRADHWMNPVYSCHWKFVTPDESIAKLLGPRARDKYGNITALEALVKNSSLNGIADQHYATTYNGLLSETVAALLNSYYNSRFSLSPMTISRIFDNVIARGTPKDASKIAAEFRRANAGLGKGTCLLDVCKSK